LIFIALTQLVSGCLTFRMSEKETKKEFKNHSTQPSFHQLTIMEKEINYVETGNDTLPTVIFIHGSPGSWSAFVDFFKDSMLLTKVKMVSVDRPGFGYSNFGHAEPSLQKQAALIKPILEKYKKNKPLILVGHSLGGPVIARIAMDYPELSNTLIFVAPSIDPELEKDEWYRKPMKSKALRWMVPTSFTTSNDEILPLKNELTQMLPLWKNITQSCIVIQGLDDGLVPAGNADFAEKMLTNAPKDIQRIEGMNHFIPWTRPELIKNAILKSID
jgi:pimeloyl-ACP methyl ester carboxylesterase